MAGKKRRKQKKTKDEAATYATTVAEAVDAALRDDAPPRPPVATPGMPSVIWLARALWVLEDLHNGRRVPQPQAEFDRLKELLGQAEACYLRLHTDCGDGVLWTAADLLSTAKELSVAGQDFERAAACRDACEAVKKLAEAYAATPPEGTPCPTPPRP